MKSRTDIGAPISLRVQVNWIRFALCPATKNLMAAPVCVADEYISLIDVAPLEKPAFLVSTPSFVRFRFLPYESVPDPEWLVK